jgi:hypothetical protein
MLIKIKLKDPKYCEGCPLLAKKEYKYYSHYKCFLYPDVNGFYNVKRHEKCIKTHG